MAQFEVKKGTIHLVIFRNFIKMRCPTGSMFDRLLRKVFLCSIMLCGLAVVSADWQNLSIDELINAPIESATLFEEDPLFVPSSVTRLDPEDWRITDARHVVEAIEGHAGVYVSPNYNGMPIPTFRGFGHNTSFKSYSILVDGVPMNQFSLGAVTWQLPHISLNSIESIEVHRGPGSALYGSDAFTGVVNVKSWRPEENTFEARTSLGNFGRGDGAVRFRVGDQVSWTFSLDHQSQENRERDLPYTDSYTKVRQTLKAEEDYEADAIFTSLNWDRLFLDFRYYRFDAEGLPYRAENYFFIPGAAPLVTFPNGGLGDLRTEYFHYGMSYSHELGGHHELDWKLFLNRGEHDSLEPEVSAGKVPGYVPGQVDRAHYVDRRYGGSVLLRKPFATGRWQYLLGASVENLEGVHLSNGPVPTSPSMASGMDRDIRSIIAQLEHGLMDHRLNLLLGGRFDSYSDVEDHFSPRASLVWHYRGYESLKLIYAHAFRAPSSLERNHDIPAVIKSGGATLKPDTIDTYELVWMRSRKIYTTKLSAFLSEWNDAVGVGISSDPLFMFEWVNGGKSRSLGFEAEYEVIYKQWEFETNFSWSRAKVTEPIENADFYRAHPEFMFNWSVGYHITRDWSVHLINRHLDGIESYADPATLSYKKWSTFCLLANGPAPGLGCVAALETRPACGGPPEPQGHPAQYHRAGGGPTWFGPRCAHHGSYAMVSQRS